MPVGHPVFDLSAALRRSRRSARRCDDGPHRAFGDLADRLVGLGELEQIELRIADVPADGVSDVDDVLVARQHQRFGACRAKRQLADVLDVDLLDPIDG